MSTTANFEIVCDSSDRATWLQARASSVGASEVAALLGESRWESALSIYTAKTRKVSKEETEAMFWGLRLERVITEVYAERTARPTQWSGLMLRSKAMPWLTCTLDAQTGVTEIEWPLDAKTANAFKTHEWAEGAPRDYYLQLQQQMLVTGASKATIACLLGAQRLIWCDVERDEIECRRIAHMSRVFWEQCVVARVPPAPDGSTASRAALAALYPEDNGNTVMLDAELEPMFDELAELQRTRKAINARELAIENAFKARLGTASRGLLPSRNEVRWTERRGKISYKEAAEFARIDHDVLEKFRGPSSRTFTIKEKL